MDEENYFLDNSDHDLMARAFLEKKYICGYVPIDFNAPLCDGSTRKDTCIHCNEYLINKEEKIRLSLLCNNKPGLTKYRDIWKYREPVIYSLE